MSPAITASNPASDRSGGSAMALGDTAIMDAPLARALLAWAEQQGLGIGLKAAEDGRYLLVNPALLQLFDRSLDQVLGHSDADLVDTATATLLRSADHTALAQGQQLASDHRFEWQGGRREFHVLRVVVTASGRRLLCCLWQDVAGQRQREAQLRVALDQLEQQQKANEQLRRERSDQDRRDQASGLNSRSHFDDQMRRELDLSTREHREFALVYMTFDASNDRVQALGERARERICEAMGRLLRGNTRAMDASCRLDEDHFAVLLSGVGLATAHARMEGLRRQCATQIVMLDGEELSFTVAVGVASFPHTAHAHAELVSACSAALAEACRRGGNTVALASIRFESDA